MSLGVPTGKLKAPPGFHIEWSPAWGMWHITIGNVDRFESSEQCALETCRTIYKTIAKAVLEELAAELEWSTGKVPPEVKEKLAEVSE